MTNTPSRGSCSTSKKSQLQVIEQASEIAGLMLGTNRSRGCCLEMICADFLAGASQDNNEKECLLLSVNRMFHESEFPRRAARGFVSSLRQRGARLRLDREAYEKLRRHVLERDRWRCQNCGSSEDLQVHHIQSRGRQGDDTLENLITLSACCHRDVHFNFRQTTSNDNVSPR